MKNIVVGFIGFAALACIPATAQEIANAKIITSTVETVIDGDTIYLTAQGDMKKPYKIRLFGIDAAEMKTREGLVARAAMDKLAPVGSEIVCQKRATDRYKRIVANCSNTLGQDLSEMMLDQGQAWTYRRYLAGSNLEERYLRAETIAQQSGKGIWANNTKNSNKSIEEWIHRYQTIIASLIALLAAVLTTVFLRIQIGLSESHHRETINIQRTESLNYQKSIYLMVHDEIQANIMLTESCIAIFFDEDSDHHKKKVTALKSLDRFSIENMEKAAELGKFIDSTMFVNITGILRSTKDTLKTCRMVYNSIFIPDPDYNVMNMHDIAIQRKYENDVEVGNNHCFTQLKSLLKTCQAVESALMLSIKDVDYQRENLKN